MSSAFVTADADGNVYRPAQPEPTIRDIAAKLDRIIELLEAQQPVMLESVELIAPARWEFTPEQFLRELRELLIRPPGSGA